MRNTHGRVRCAALVLLALGLATPAAAQFGGLKKKLKAAAGSEAATEAQKAADAPDASSAPAANGTGANAGAVVMTPDVVDQLLAGLKAGKAYREAALKAETPYGRYHQQLAAYQTAKSKCAEAQQTWGTRAAADEKLSNQYTELIEKMAAASGKGDTKAAMAFQNQAMALMDPSCTVQEPQQPDNYYELQRDVDTKAEQTAVKSSGLSGNEYYWASDKALGVLSDNPPPDVSASEKSAVNGKAAELKPLMGFKDESAERQKKAAPAAAAPAPAPQPAAPAVDPATAQLAECMGKNGQKHEKEIMALGERAKAAQEAGDMNKTLAIADSIRRLQTAGCQGAQ